MSFRRDHPFASCAFASIGYAAGVVAVANLVVYEEWEAIPNFLTSYLVPSKNQCNKPQQTAGVVFTGTDERIAVAEGLAKRYNYGYLLISGTSATAALDPNEHGVPRTCFQRRSSIGQTQVFVDHCARNTKQNAYNTFKWVDELSNICRLYVTTSQVHGVRAAVWLLDAFGKRKPQALGKQKPQVAIDFTLVADHTSTPRERIKEMIKTYAAVIGIYQRGPIVNAIERGLYNVIGLKPSPVFSQRAYNQPRQHQL